ncbi:hypothetical protein [Alkaliphilus transvaalensis]|uniref:hypothetical protein n=1 Tax=Alkaliphilus transvaalensis TaxID=114628 RepID=UPI00047D0B92|nr:hypothetical protein [Alkaliphilus transvaalensis]
MNFDILNTTILLVGGLAALWETLLQMSGKRVLKNRSSISNLSFVAPIVIGASLFLEEILFIFLVYLGIVLVCLLIRYFGGVGYRIDIDQLNGVDFSKIDSLVKQSIDEIEYEQPEIIKEDQLIKYTFSDNGRTIEVKEKESTFTEKKTYHVNFKRWFNLGSKKEVLYFIETAITQGEDRNIKRNLKLLFQLIFTVGLLGFGLFLMSQQVISPKNIQQVILDELPMVYVVKEDQYLEDEELVLQLHHILQDSYNFKGRNNAMDLQNPDLIVYYGNEGRVLYINNYIANLYLPNSEIGSRTIFHKFLLQIYELFHQEEGTQYRIVIGPEGWINIIDRILESPNIN